MKKSYKILLTAAAEKDLAVIVEYMTHTLANPVAANSFIDEVEECFALLARTPFVYAKCNDPRLKIKGYRKAVINNYVLIYRVEEKTETFIYSGHSMVDKTIK